MTVTLRPTLDPDLFRVYAGSARLGSVRLDRARNEWTPIGVGAWGSNGVPLGYGTAEEAGERLARSCERVSMGEEGLEQMLRMRVLGFRGKRGRERR